MDKYLGKHARDKVTGLEGIIVGRVEYLYGCAQYGIIPPAKDGKIEDTHYFDEGRIEIIDDALRPDDVAGEKPGPDIRDDTPKSTNGLR